MGSWARIGTICHRANEISNNGLWVKMQGTTVLGYGTVMGAVPEVDTNFIFYPADGSGMFLLTFEPAF